MIHDSPDHVGGPNLLCDTQASCGQSSFTQVAGEEIERYQMKKSMSGYAYYYEGPGHEAYDDKCHIEYFSETRAKWPLGG